MRSSLRTFSAVLLVGSSYRCCITCKGMVGSLQTKLLYRRLIDQLIDSLLGKNHMRNHNRYRTRGKQKSKRYNPASCSKQGTNGKESATLASDHGDDFMRPIYEAVIACSAGNQYCSAVNSQRRMSY